MDYESGNLNLHFVTEDDLAEIARTWPADTDNKSVRDIVREMKMHIGTMNE